MKRVTTIILALVLCLGMSMTALAAPSPTLPDDTDIGDEPTPGGDETTPGEDETTPGGEETTPSGEETTPAAPTVNTAVDTAAIGIDDSVVVEAVSAAAASGAQAKMEQIFKDLAKKMPSLTADKVKAYVFEVSRKDGSTDGADVELQIPGVTANNGVMIYVGNADGTDWQQATVTYLNDTGKIKVSFPHFSPVLAVVTPKEVAGGNTAPKTGDMSVAGVIALMALCGAGILAVNRKKIAWELTR